ncbi:sulfatase-like hydrolase/transferase [Microlunatus endophyticus]|uniref:sulfatase-like hydrolase/transferase n=1 Tax=Microlunatus endophyticus TaxID=1716077 RepID=UPI001E473A14|nr:sulfatase-like hydrolase/transferase [Microlunatus endophyticus]
MVGPNIIVIMTDDQGYADLSCAGSSDLATPHLDEVAATGVRFTNFYAGSAVCSPSRASLLTGRYPGNAGVRSILAGHRTATGLSPTVPTIAGLLKPAGYRTSMTGKWHLGVSEDCRPDRHGFDDWYGFLAGCVDYYSHIFYWGMADGRTDPVHDLWDNGEETYDNGRYLTEMITRRAVSQIRSAARSDRPFFSYVAYNAPHYPMHAPRAYLDRFPHLPDERRVMAAMIAAVDDGVGAILRELDRHGLRDDTMIVFCSDNGPSRETRNWLDGTSIPYRGGTTGPLKGHKYSLYEGGIRVPGIISWPARIPAGQVVDLPCSAVDVLPTILAAARLDAAGLELDGTSLLDVLSGAAMAPAPADRQLFWELGDQTAVREGRWKLVLNGQLVEGETDPESVFLADLEQDVAEQHNLAGAEPGVTARLTAAATDWRAGIEQRWTDEWLPLQTGTAALA